MTEGCVHHFVLGASDTRERNRGRCRKCGVVKHFGDTRYDMLNMVVKHQPPALDARTKCLLFLKQHESVRLDWDGFTAAVGCGYTALGDLVRTLKNEGVVVEVEEMAYALVEPDSG